MADTQPSLYEDEFSVAELIGYILNGWKIIIATLVIIMLVTLYFISSAPVKYETKMVIMPAENSLSQANVQSSGSGFSSLASVIVGSTAEGSSLSLFLEMMHSRTVALKMIEKHDTIKEIYASAWDSKKQEWIKPGGGLRSSIYKLFGIPTWTPPNASTLAKYVEGMIEADLENIPLITLVMEHKDPKFAEKFMAQVFEATDNLIRQQHLQRLETQKQHLRKRIAQETSQTYQRTFISLLISVEQKEMLIMTDQPYLAEVIDGPVSSALPISPKPDLALLVGLVAGLMLGLMLALLKGIFFCRLLPDMEAND